MSNSGKFVDRVPFKSQAGHTSAIQGISVDNSLRQDLYCKRGSTPENIKKYRKSEKEIVGRKQLHPGIYDDPKDYENYTHGVKTLCSDHVNDCIKGNNLNGVNHFLNQIKEKKYSSAQREPLGKSLQRNYAFPDEVKKHDFKFGVPTVCGKL
jgi:hypothetical protein